MGKDALVILGLSFLFATTSPAYAGPEGDFAREKNKEATAAFNLGHYNEAASAFEAAYKAVLDPVLLYNIGQSYRLGRNPEKALTAYRSYLRTMGPNAPNWKQVEEKIRELETELATKSEAIKPEHPPSDSKPDNTASPAAPAPTTIPAALAAPPTLSPIPPTTSIQTSTTLRNEGLLLGRTWTWVAGGAAVLFAGTAVTAGLMMRFKFDSLKKECGSMNATRPGCSQAAIDSVATRRTVANIFWGLSAAATATAGILFFSERLTISAAPMASSVNGLLLSGRF